MFLSTDQQIERAKRLQNSVSDPKLVVQYQQQIDALEAVKEKEIEEGRRPAPQRKSGGRK